MPDQNGTGPQGKGPMTGRGSGKCILPLNSKSEELAFLKNQESILTQELKSVQARIEALSKTRESEEE